MHHSLIALTDIPDDGAVTVEFFGRKVLVYKVDGQARATANICTHLGGPLERCGDTFVCAWHQGTFDVASGTRLSGPARPRSRLMTLPTLVLDGVLTYVWADRVE